ncbi:MAG: DUF1361 domain-containing protein [Chloroflexi bacterium]|nr:DUF1361 domain-containing protein [Chloroflexota bacterium]
MFNKLKTGFQRNRYKIAIFFLMASASAVCVLLVAARIAYSDSGRYTTLVWNLFLAWIPFILAYFAYAFSWKKWQLYLVLPASAFLWLIFFPNAPYILTDLQHLARETSSAPIWYDVIVMVWFSWTGLLLGLVSLYLMHDIVQRTFGRLTGWAFVFIVSGLSSFGVYLGRFVRFNSWDILNDPKEIVVTILGLAVDPSKRLVAFTALFSIFYIFVYLTLYSFAHLLQEQTHPIQKELP